MHCLGTVNTMTFHNISGKCLLASRHETDVNRNLEPVTDNGIGHIAHPFAIDYCFSTTTGLAYTIEAGIKIVL